LTAGVNPSDLFSNHQGVSIKGNQSSTQGGGIASQGIIYIGDDHFGPKVKTSTTFKFVLQNKDTFSNLPETIEVSLCVELHEYGLADETIRKIHLTKSNNYEYVLELPDKLYIPAREGETSSYKGTETLIYASMGEGKLSIKPTEYTDGPENFIFSIPVTEEIIGGDTGNDEKRMLLSASIDWQDDDNRDNSRPDKLILELIKVNQSTDGNKIETVVSELEVNPSNEWKGAFGYYLREDYQKYKVDIKGSHFGYYHDDQADTQDENGNFTVKLIHDPHTLDISVEVNWFNADFSGVKRPDSISVNLYNQQTEEMIGDAIVLSPENNWSGHFPNQFENLQGSEIPYQIKISSLVIDGQTADDTALHDWQNRISVVKDSKTSFVLFYEKSEAEVIYWGGDASNDSNDGSSANQAVASLDRVKLLLQKMPSINTVVVCGSMPLTSDLSSNALGRSKPVTFLRSEGFKEALFEISGVNIKISDIIIDGNRSRIKANGPLISVIDSGTLIIDKNTSLINNENAPINSGGTSEGGAIYLKDSTIEVKGGLISNNIATFGGGIYLSSSKLTISDGNISKNIARLSISNGGALAAGGGICATENSTIKLQANGNISQNISDEIGGGISLGNQYLSSSHNKLLMTGGAIEGNQAGASGGGIFIQVTNDVSKSGKTNEANILAGSITNNKAGYFGYTEHNFAGGGIYVNGINPKSDPQYANALNGHLYLSNALIFENEADLDGGGLACCPSSSSEIFTHNGAAIFDNRENDIFISSITIYTFHTGTPPYNIDGRIFNGAKPIFYKVNDNNIIEQLAGKGTFGPAKIELLEEIDWSTLAQRMVIISGNFSYMNGGGIGSNGDVTIGEPGTINLQIVKSWSEGTEAEPITVQIRGRIEELNWDWLIEEIVLDEGNQYSAVLEELPPTILGYNLEDVIYPKELSDKYDMDYRVERIAENGSSKIVLNINNKPSPTTPPNPSTPPTPTTPPTPSTPRIEIPLKITVTKAWEDQDNQAGFRPNRVTIRLYADGKDTGKFVFLEPERDWSASFWDLPKYDGDHQIEYSVREEPVARYDSRITGDPVHGFVITNTLREQPPTDFQDKIEQLPKTGEQSNTALWNGVLILGLSALVLQLRKKH
jgi:LPXTG-motif cell wall-anchored protein